MSYCRTRGYSNSSSSSGLSLAFAAVVLAVSYFFSRESAADVKKKPDLIAATLNRTNAICIKYDKENAEQSYGSRMKSVLKDTRTSALEILSEKGVSVCLDTRLIDQQRTRFFGSGRATAVYNTASKVLTIQDNGITTDSFWGENVKGIGKDNLEALSKAPEILNDDSGYVYGAFRRCGYKCRAHHTVWRLIPTDLLSDNLWMGEPPIE